MRAPSLVSLLPFLAASSALPTPDGAASSFLITRDRPADHTCYRDAYYGVYGSEQEHIYLLSPECLSTVASLQSGSIVPAPNDATNARNIWVGHAGVADLADSDVADSWSGIEAKVNELLVADAELLADAPAGQHPFGASYSHVMRPITLLHQSHSSLLLSVPEDYLPFIDTFLPSHLVPVALPLSPLPASPEIRAADWEPVPERFAKNLANLTQHLTFDPKLDKILSHGIQLNDIRRNVRWLTGEGPSGIESRHSFTPGAVKAAHWIKLQVERSGASCHLEDFLSGFSPNVICYYPTQTNSSELVVLSAHYDSRGSWGSTRAPGGDDDGSGSGHLLAVAHAIGEAKVKFDKQVVVAFFAGEEQGLLGSHAYAGKLHEVNATVLLHIQADMLGYHAPGEPMQLGLPESIHLPEASYLVGNISHLYSPELLVGTTAACCSDHQSFIAYGFPATQVFERAGWIADPKYHNTGDLSQREGYDFDQIVSIAKVTMASILTVAGWSA